MPNFNFRDWLQQLDLEEQATDQYTASLNALREVTDALEERLNSGLPDKPIAIELIPGLQATRGQQFNVKLRIPERGFQDGLFRAYIPLDGLPVTLDLYGDELMPCESLEKMEQQIANFLNEIQSRLTQYRTFARSL